MQRLMTVLQGLCVDLRGLRTVLQPLSTAWQGLCGGRGRRACVVRRFCYIWRGRATVAWLLTLSGIMATTTPGTTRQFRPRLEELGPLDDMVQAMFNTDRKDFAKASPDYADPNFLKDWQARRADFSELVPSGARRATAKEVTKTMGQVAKSLRDPLNWLNIRLNRAAKKGDLAVAVDDFGLGKVRSEISTHDMEGLDGALGYLRKLLADPANQQALTDQGHTAADTKAFADAQKQLSTFNTTQNSNQNVALDLTDENIKAGNALWEYITDVLGTGALMYKETNPKKAKTYAVATLMKRMRQEHGGGGEVQVP